MKKQLVIIGILAILVTFGISGCDSKVENNTPESPVIGDWVGEKTANYNDPPNSYEVIITEIDLLNNSVAYVIMKFTDNTTQGYNGTYEIDKLSKILYLYIHDDSFAYHYSINGNKLILNGSVFTNLSLILSSPMNK